MQTTTMIRRAAIAAAALLAPLASAGAQGAQGTLGARVAQVREGEVRLTFESRPGTCGDGRDMVSFRRATFARDLESWGGYRSHACTAGPLRVALTVANGRVSALRTQVGGDWGKASGPVTDLGTVSPREASSYLFSLVPALESASGKDRLLLPAVLAADAPVVAPLVALARDASRTTPIRRAAVVWLGLVGDASVVPVLVGFATQEEASGKKGLAGAALNALASLDEGAGVPALLELSRHPRVSLRHDAMFWLGQSGDPRAVARLHQVIEDGREETKVRAHAVFALSHGTGANDDWSRWLRERYPTFGSDELKEQVLLAEHENGADGGRWLMGRARDTREPTKLRKSALFWAGQNESTPTAEIVRVAREDGDATLREHALFVLSQRPDAEATDALLRIAREDGSTKVRGRALFWLAQKDDPRVTKLIADLVTKP